jgi:glycosyltransferase involved in cell wall biosynthesis
MAVAVFCLRKKTMKHNFKIIVCNYNNGKFLKQSLESLKLQTYKNWTAIIADDCSTDESLRIINSIILNDNRFQLIKNTKNLGLQKTLYNCIAVISTNDIFARLDPDDVLAPKAIELSLKAHLDYPEVGLVYSNSFFCNENLEPINVHKSKQIFDLNEDYFNFKGQISHFASFKKSFYDLTTGIDVFNKRAEDKDIFMKMCEIAPVKHIDETLYYYRIHNSGASTMGNSEKALFWHWVALIKMSERRNVNIEQLFVDSFVSRTQYEDVLFQLNRITSNKFYRLLHFFKTFLKSLFNND